MSDTAKKPAPDNWDLGANAATDICEHPPRGRADTIDGLMEVTGGFIACVSAYMARTAFPAPNTDNDTGPEFQVDLDALADQYARLFCTRMLAILDQKAAQHGTTHTLN